MVIYFISLLRNGTLEDINSILTADKYKISLTSHTILYAVIINSFASFGLQKKIVLVYYRLKTKFLLFKVLNIYNIFCPMLIPVDPWHQQEQQFLCGHKSLNNLDFKNINITKLRYFDLNCEFRVELRIFLELHRISGRPAGFPAFFDIRYPARKKLF